MKKIFFFFFLIFNNVIAQDIPNRVQGSYVHDFSDILTPSEEAQLHNQLIQLKEKYTIETAIVTIPTTGDNSIDDYTLKLAREWGVGGKSNNGLVILAAIEDRKWRVEVGYGLEGDLPDILTKQLAEDYLVPKFKQDKYAEGFSQLITKIDYKISPEAKAIAKAEKDKRDELDRQTKQKVKNFFIILFQIVIFGAAVFAIFYYTKKKKKEKEQKLEKAKKDLNKTVLELHNLLDPYRVVLAKTKVKEEKLITKQLKDKVESFLDETRLFLQKDDLKKITQLDDKIKKFLLSEETIETQKQIVSIANKIIELERLNSIQLNWMAIDTTRKEILYSFKSNNLESYLPDFEVLIQEVEIKQTELIQKLRDVKVEFDAALERKDIHGAKRRIAEFSAVKRQADELNQDLSNRLQKALKDKRFVDNFDSNTSNYLNSIIALCSMVFISNLVREQAEKSIQMVKAASAEIPKDATGFARLTDLSSKIERLFAPVFKEKEAHDLKIKKQQEEKKRKEEEDRRRKRREQEEEDRRRSSYYSSSSSSDSWSSSSSSSSSDYSGGSFGGGGSSGDW